VLAEDRHPDDACYRIVEEHRRRQRVAGRKLGFLERDGCSREQRQHGHDRDDMGEVDLAGAADRAIALHQGAAGQEFREIGERSREAGQEHENFRRVRSAKIARRRLP